MGIGRQSGSVETKRRHYYADEADGPILFGARGKVLVGSEGCSPCFILGLADVEEPETLATDLAAPCTQCLLVRAECGNRLCAANAAKGFFIGKMAEQRSNRKTSNDGYVNLFNSYLLKIKSILR